MPVDATVCDTAAGCFAGSSGEFSVTLRRLGEGLALSGLSQESGCPLATVSESSAFATVFESPRLGADRYPDWAAFEHHCRITAGPLQTRVWRIAEADDRVCYLGQSFEKGTHFPLAAALWSGWHRPTPSWRGLFWQGSRESHLWILRPSEFPLYVRLEGATSADSLAVVAGRYGDVRGFTLDIGGVSAEFRAELALAWPGPLLPVESFAGLHVSSSLRARLLDLADPSPYLPAVGAARALLEGPPKPLASCASSPAVAAAGG